MSLNVVTESIEHLDFELPCEHSKHDTFHVPDDPAAWIARWRCPECNRGRTYLLCDSGLLDFKEMETLVCPNCRHGWLWFQCVTILGPVR